jgi:hypothetical protein
VDASGTPIRRRVGRWGGEVGKENSVGTGWESSRRATRTAWMLNLLWVTAHSS